MSKKKKTKAKSERLTVDEFEKWFEEWQRHYEFHTGEKDRATLKKILAKTISSVEPEEDRNMLLLKYSEHLK